MRCNAVTVAAALAFCAGLATPARAELVFFPSGRALSVKAVRSDGTLLILKLRSGGEITCDRDLIVKVEPDEIEYPEEVLEATSSAKRIIEPPAIPERYREIITTAAARHGVDARIVHALIQVESAYETHAVSRAGARGLMQITPETADTIETLSGGETFVYEDLANPELNIRYGVFYLHHLLERFAGNEIAMLAGYNGGPENAAAWGGAALDLDDIAFAETRAYVEGVLELRKEYRDNYATELGLD
jgi:soluble lytic murein transglycosylase